MTDIRGRSAGPDSKMAAKDVASDVAATAKEQAQEVVHETAAQARHVAEDVRQRVGREADNQAQRVAQGINRLADELTSMAKHSSEDSPAAGALNQVADTGRQVARFLDERGVGGVLESTQNFARRNPGTFLLGAAVAGFLVGRVVKSATGSPPSRSGEQTGAGYATPSYDTRLPVPETRPAPTGAVPQAAPAAYPPVDPQAPRAPQYSAPGGGAPHVQP